MMQDYIRTSFCDVLLLLQSTPSLIISLVGLLYTGNLLEKSVKNTSLYPFPLLLQTNCILAFKGNVELIYALYLSSMRQSSFFLYSKYMRYAFDNANLVLFQSTIIGFIVGIIGVSKSVLNGNMDIDILTIIVSSSMTTCIFSTLLFIIFLLVLIEFSKKLYIDLDNVILPALSALSDYLSIYFLVYFTKFFMSMNVYASFFIIASLICLVPVFVIFTLLSSRRLPIQSIEILFFTYLTSTAGGYILDNMAVNHKFIASLFPVYTGLAVSISFIYLHKIFSSSNNNTYHNQETSYVTLVLASSFLIFVYTLLSFFIGPKKTTWFYILFNILFILQAAILLKLVEKLAKSLENYNGDVGVVSLPLVTAIGDILSTIFLVAISIVCKLFRI